MEWDVFEKVMLGFSLYVKQEYEYIDGCRA
jgi:hypothetical protein